MLRGGFCKAGSSGNGGEYPMWRTAGGHPHGSRPGNDPGNHSGAEVMLSDFKCGCPVYRLRIHGSTARDRWAGGAGANTVPAGSIPKCAVSVLRAEEGPDQRAVLGERRLCAAV